MQKLYKRIDDNMLDVGRYSRYYLAIADRRQKWHLVFTMVILVGTLAAGVLILTSPAYTGLRWASAGLFFLVGVATIVTTVFDFSRVAQLARGTADRLDEIDVQLRQLWFDAEDNSDDSLTGYPRATINETLLRLEREIDAVTRVDITTNYRLNKKCSQEAERVLEAFYREKTPTK